MDRSAVTHHLHHQYHNKRDSVPNTSILSEIFGDSPLLQRLPKPSPLAPHTSPYAPGAPSTPIPETTSPSLLQSSEGNCASSIIKREDQEEEFGPPAKRVRLDSQSGIVDTVESSADARYRPIAQATAERRRLEPDRASKPAKLRTKTGCYTCRERRVKCDQGRPVCLRCTRAKRECKGYDPTLEPGPVVHLPELEKKQRIIPNPRGRGRRRQPTPPPVAAVAFAEETTGSRVGETSSLRATLRSRRRSSSRSSEEAASSSTRAAKMPGIHDELGAAFDAHLHGASDIEFRDSLDSIAIDPALAAAAAASAAANNNATGAAAELPTTTTTTTASSAAAPQLFGFSSSPSANINSLDSSSQHFNQNYNHHVDTNNQRDPLTMAALCKVGGEDPPKIIPASPSPAAQDDLLKEIDYLYRTTYAPAIDVFLECQWYANHSFPYLQKSHEAMTCFTSVLHLFKDTKTEQYDLMRRLPSSESELIWALMRLPRSVDAALASQSPELQVVLNRLLVVERLITGQQMTEAPIDDATIHNTNHKKFERRVKFWRSLNAFVGTVRSSSAAASPIAQGGADTPMADSSSPSTPTIDTDQTLKEMRGVLEGQENRDVLYSIAVVQHYGSKFPSEVGRSFTPTSNGKQNGHSAQDKADLDKLRVAKRFLEDEAQDQGMSQVVQRLCGMAVRSWSHLIS